MNVLKGFDLKKYKPTLIMLEFIIPTTKEFYQNNIQIILSNFDSSCVINQLLLNNISAVKQGYMAENRSQNEYSYKQFDPSPRYNARDSAIILAGLYSSKVLLGSAPPSIESYTNANKSKNS